MKGNTGGTTGCACRVRDLSQKHNNDTRSYGLPTFFLPPPLSDAVSQSHKPLPQGDNNGHFILTHFLSLQLLWFRGQTISFPPPYLHSARRWFSHYYSAVTIPKLWLGQNHPFRELAWWLPDLLFVASTEDLGWMVVGWSVSQLVGCR